MMMEKPEINPTFFYGPVVSHKFHGNISKDKGKYRIRFSLYFKSGDEYKTQKSGFNTEEEAEKAKEVMIAELANGKYVPFHYTVKEYFDYYLYHYMMEEVKIRYNTYQSYKNSLYNYLLPALGEKTKLKDIHSSDLKKAINDIPYEYSKLSCMKITKMAFAFAVKNNYIAHDPSLLAIELLKKDMPKKEKRNIPPYTIEQLGHMLLTCKEYFYDMYMPLLLSLTIGSRISETIGIKYTDVDFSSKKIYIYRQLGRNINESGNKSLVTQPLETKTPNGVREIPITDWIIDEIIAKRAWYTKQKKKIADFHDYEYICCHCDGRPFNRQDFLDDFKSLLIMCGLPSIHWHDLRHFYATKLKNHEINMKAISEYMGHHSADFTKNVYIYTEDAIYDCTILYKIWEETRPDIDDNRTDIYIPFTDEYYYSLLNGSCNNFNHVKGYNAN